MMFDGRKITTLVMFALFAGTCVMALDLPQKAAFMPLLIGIPGAILCAAQFVVDLRRRDDAPVEAAEEAAGDDGQGRSEGEVFAWLGLFSFALIGFGFVIGGPVVVGAYIRFSSRDRWRTALFAAGGTFAVIWGVFVWLLELSLFPGLIAGSLVP